MGDTSSDGSGTYAPANWMGLTASGTAPDVSHTTLAGEISSGSLSRAHCSFAHTDGQASYTLTKTFTSDQVVTVQKQGIFNAASGGTLVFESLLDAPAVLRSGDQVAITVTVSL